MQSGCDGSAIVAQGYMSHLRSALGVVVGCLENYSMAYEALDGMRGEFVDIAER